jgi:hypothetical protein
MAPISSPIEVEVRLSTRLEIRQTPQPYLITQTVTRDFTTYTTTITLGTIIAPTLTTPAPTIIQTVAPAPAPAKTTTDSNNGVVIGAVLGTLLGLAVLLALAWKCCFDGRSILWRPVWGGEDESSYGSGSQSLGSSRSSWPKVRRRGGELRRPKRAHVRRERRGSVDYEGIFDGRSEGSWRDEKRRRRGSRTVVRDGMVGWALGGGGGGRRGSERRRRSENRRDSWVESERVRMRFTTDD